MKLLRLKGRKICAFVRARGRVWKGKTLVIHWIPGPPRHPGADPSRSAAYVGTYASAGLHKSAVTRNRMRRRCREALRLGLAKIPDLPPAQLLLTPRSPSLQCGFALIEADVSQFLSLLPHG